MLNFDDITVCMIHFNRPGTLLKVLPSWNKFSKMFLWDNDSVSHYKNLVKAYCLKNKNITPIFYNQNVGWPKAINQMIINSETDWVMIAADDICLGNDWICSINNLLEWKPNLEQIYLHSFDCMLFHKKTIARFGWWEERQPTVSPTAEDDDWYLRLVEYLGYSPYVFPGEHIVGEEREKRLKRISTKEIMERKDNISYFCNTRWGISSINFSIAEITRDKQYVEKYCNKGPKSGLDFHKEKWCETDNEKDLLNKDCTYWKRILSDMDFYPDMRKYYRNLYNIW